MAKQVGACYIMIAQRALSSVSAEIADVTSIEKFEGRERA